MCACQKSYTPIIMTSITWAGPKCVQEAAAILGPQNRIQGRCVQYRCQNCWTLSLRLPSPGRMKQSAGGKYPRRQILLFNLTLSLGTELSRDSAVLGRGWLFQFATVSIFIFTEKIKRTLDFVVILIFSCPLAIIQRVINMVGQIENWKSDRIIWGRQN